MLFRSEKKLRSECEQLRLRLHELEEQLTQKQASRRQADARQTHAHIIYDDRELNEPPPAFKPRPPSRQPARALSSSSRLLEMASRRPDKGSGRSVSLSRAYLTKDVGSPTPLTTSTPCLNAHRLGASLASLPSLLTKVDIRINGQVVEFDPASIGEVTGASEVAGSSEVTGASEVVTGSSESVESKKEVGVTGASKVTGSSAVGVTEPGGVTVEEDRPLMFNKNDIGLYVPCYQPDDPCMPRRHGNKRSSIRDDDDVGSDGDDSRHVGSAHDDSNHDDSSVDSGCHDGSPTSSFQRKVKGDGKVTRGQLEVTALHMFDVRECGGGSKSPGSRQGSSEGRPSSSVLAEELGVIESAFEGIDQDQLAFI
ncbi:PREDICTED: uncharacterized protein LOC106818633 [Priapulus caudatus]|uniref:Uncharacterized protein LOC106818633 n=1 Tax=Priapulus caudatus TaxID=37621 RepID=A0ABM1F2Y8_PRICU|nr:PREDICTED: uncharacterized protein LOC106818633 [Priapulus caudatus]